MNRFKWVLSKVDDAPILDIGCGSLSNPIRRDLMKKYGKLYVGFDIRPSYHPDIVGDAHHLPFKDNSFKIVLLCEILEHVEDDKKVLEEAIRVASKKVIFTTPNEWEWSERLKPFKHAEHVRFYTKETITELLSNCCGNLPYYVEDLKYEGWAFFVGEIFKEVK
mgnify:CR=1 FL=1